MKTVETASGFICEIDEAAANDMELLDLFVEIDEAEDPSAKMLLASKIARKLLGDAERKRLYDHIRADKGNVPVDRFMEEFHEIIHGLGDDKKKSSSSPE